MSQGVKLELLDADERGGRMALRIVDLVMVSEGKLKEIKNSKFYQERQSTLEKQKTIKIDNYSITCSRFDLAGTIVFCA